MKKRGCVTSCADGSKIFKQIRNSKYNNKLLGNGDIRIGDDLAMDSKTHLVYKL